MQITLVLVIFFLKDCIYYSKSLEKNGQIDRTLRLLNKFFLKETNERSFIA